MPSTFAHRGPRPIVRRVLPFAGVALALLIVPSVAHFYTEVRWFRSLGQEHTFGRILGTELLVASLAGLLVCGLLLANLWIALRLGQDGFVHRLP